MRLTRQIVCLLLATVCASASARMVGATYNVLDVHQSNVPNSPPLVMTTALLNVTATDPIFVRAGLCQQNLVCNATNFVRCCSDDQCDYVTYTRLPTTPADCACPLFPGVICLDPSRPFAFGEAAAEWATSNPNGYAFEIPVARSCRNTVITVTATRGFFSLFLGTASQTLFDIYRAPVHISAMSNSNGVTLCAADGDGDEFLYSNNGYRNTMLRYKTDLAADGWGRIRGIVAGFGSFVVTVSEVMHPLGIIPLVSDQNVHTHVHTAFTVNCEDGTYQRTGYSNFTLPAPIQPTADPLYDFTLVQGMLRRAPTTMNPRQFSAIISVGSDLVYSQTPSVGDLSNCRFNLSALTDADGVPLAPQPIIFTEETNSECDAEQLSALSAAHAQLLPSFPALLPVLRVNAAITTDMGVAPSVLWARCKRAARSLLVNNTYAVTTTRCYATPGTTEYATDPCCSQDRTWQQCCLPRPVFASNSGPNENLLQTQCATPACSSQVAITYAEVTARQSSAACTTELSANLAGVSDIFSTEESGYEPGPCRGLLDSGTDEEFIACVTTSLDALYVQEFLTLWNVTNEQMLATTGGFETLVRRRYAVTNGCVQLGVVPYDIIFKVMRRFTFLDSNPTLCLTTPDCNWQGQQNPFLCVNSFRGPNMCAACANGYCTDYTVPQLCYGLNVVSAVTPSVELCTRNGGVLDFDYGCRYPNRSDTRDNCLPPTICSQASNTCKPSCHYTAIADRLSCEASPDRLWLSTGACVEYDIFLEDCEAAGGTFFTGARWQEGFLSDQASCQAAGGYCAIAPGLNESACLALAAVPSGRCSVYCPNCTKAQCEATVGCAEDGLFDTPSGGATCVGDFYVYSTATRTCGGGYAAPEIGCVYNEKFVVGSPQRICEVFGGRLVAAPTLPNRTQCESFGRCREASFDPDVTTPKSPEVCAACGGTYLPAFEWTNGTWIPDELPSPLFVPLNWTARQFAPRYFLGDFFDRGRFAAEFYDIRVLRTLRFANQNALCRNAQLESLVTSLACDCLGSDGATCYTTPQFQLLLLQRVCGGNTQAYPFSAVANSGSFAVGASARFTPACVDVEVSVVPVELFRRTNDRVYASVFVQTISGDQYEVIQNERSIVVGALVGDGVRLTVSGGAIAGPIELCLTTELPADERFSVVDFATVDADLDPESLRALGLTCTTNGSLICCTASSSLGEFYFPVRRVPKPGDARLLDTLTTTQRNCFWAATALYLILWIVVTYRLVNAVLFLILRPGRFPWANLTLLGLVGALLFVATLLRWTYFIVTPLGGLVNASAVGDLIYAELPFYLYLSIFTVFVAWWIEIYHWATSAKKTFLKNARWVLIGVNAAMYSLFLAVIIAYAVESDRTSAIRSVCVSPAAASSNRSARTLAKVYKITVSVIAAALGVGFIVYGSILVRVLTASSATNVRSVISFTVVAVTCALGLLVQCGVLLYTTFAPRGVKTEAALAILIVAEVIPGIALVMVTKQPTTQSGWREYVWCLYSPDASSTTSASNSQYRASSATSNSKSGASSGARTSASDSEAGGAEESRF